MIIFDLSNIFFINLHASMEKSDEKDKDGNKIKKFDPTACRYMMLNMIRGVTSRYKGKFGEVVFAADDRHLWRKEFFKPYKSHRKADREAQDLDWTAIFAFFDEFKKEIKTYTKYKLIEVPGAEGDDVIATLAIKYADQNNLIVSTDKDFKQLQVYTKCTIYHPVDSKIISASDPFQYLHEHIIRGDKSDGVPNIFSPDTIFQEEGRQVSITEARLDYLMRNTISDWGSEESLEEHFAKHGITKPGPQEKERKLFVLGKQQYLERNKPLIDLREIPEEIQEAIIDKYTEEVKQGPRSLFDYFYKYNLTQLMSSISDF